MGRTEGCRVLVGLDGLSAEVWECARGRGPLVGWVRGMVGVRPTGGEMGGGRMKIRMHGNLSWMGQGSSGD